MKKIFLSIVLLLSFGFGFSQGGYGGIIYDNRATLASIRPYILSRISEKDLGSMTYYPVVGAGMNTLGNISVQVGFDLAQSISKSEKTKILAGFGLELLGWDEVHQDYMPNLRFGLETKNFILMTTTNYKFKTMLIEGVKAFEPNIKPTVGLFYKINRR